MMSLTIHQSWNNITKSAQRQVDFSGFLHAVACCSSLGCSLRTSQIHKVQLWCFVLFISFIITLLWINVDGKNAVRSRWLSIHVCSSCGSVVKADLHIFFHRSNRVYFDLYEILDKNAFIWTLFQVHLSFSIFSKQVMNFFIVDFHKTASNEMSFSSIIFSLGDDLTEGSRDYASCLFTICPSHHGMCFTTTCLTVGENGPVVSI